MRLALFTLSVLAWLFIKHFGIYLLNKLLPSYEKYINRAVNLLLTVGYGLWLSWFIRELESSLTFRAIIVSSFVGALYFFNYQFFGNLSFLKTTENTPSANIMESTGISGIDDKEKSQLNFKVVSSEKVSSAIIKGALIQQAWVVPSRRIKVQVSELEANNYLVEAQVYLLDTSKQDLVISAIKDHFS